MRASRMSSFTSWYASRPHTQAKKALSMALATARLVNRICGVLTASYLDPGCTVQVGDEPNVRGSHRLLAAGMDVRSQNTWPSLRFDVKAANQLVSAFLPAGFYYKTFIKPQRLWPAYSRVLRRFSL